jgi:hypothetical protein
VFDQDGPRREFSGFNLIEEYESRKKVAGADRVNLAVAGDLFRGEGDDGGLVAALLGLRDDLTGRLIEPPGRGTEFRRTAVAKRWTDVGTWIQALPDATVAADAPPPSKDVCARRAWPLRPRRTEPDPLTLLSLSKSVAMARSRTVKLKDARAAYSHLDALVGQIHENTFAD